MMKTTLTAAAFALGLAGAAQAGSGSYVSYIHPSNTNWPYCIAFETHGDGGYYGFSVNDPAASALLAALTQSQITGRPVYFNTGYPGAPFHPEDCPVTYITDFTE
jgi:hypothetical protein